jgi:L-ascorbate metabolism protein UlaG (beta-lactamase superfamily)
MQKRAIIIAAIMGLAACAQSPLRPSLKQYDRLLPSAEPAHVNFKVNYWGVSSLAFSDDTLTILIDGFATRPNLLSLLFTSLRPSDERIDGALASLAPNAPVRAIFVAHSHFDHAMDAPTIAKRSGATIFGSASMAVIAAAEGVPDRQFIELEDRSTHTVGQFTVRSFVTPHAAKERFPGTILKFIPPARVEDYRTGLNYSFLIKRGGCSILVVPSAGQVGNVLAGLKADIVFLGVGELGKKDLVWIDHYWNDTIGMVQPKVIVPIHWDDFTRKIRVEPLPMPPIADPIEPAMRILEEKARKSDIRFILPIAMKSVDLEDLGDCDAKLAN